MKGGKGSFLFLIMQIALALTLVFSGGGGELEFHVKIGSTVDHPLVMSLAGLWAVVAEDHGTTRADLRAIRTLLTTIFRKYKTEMQVGGQNQAAASANCAMSSTLLHFLSTGFANAHVEPGASLRRIRALH